MQHSYTWLIVIVLLIILIAGYALYLAYPIYKARSMALTATPYVQAPERPTLTILVAGDSTAVGVGAASSSASVAGRLGAEYPDARINNLGVSGLRLAGLLETLQALPADQTYDLILLQIGGNDIVGRTPLSEVKRQLSEVLDRAQTHGREVVVVTSGNVGLAPAFRIPLRQLFEKRTLQVRSIFMEEIAKRQAVSYVDLFRYRSEDIFGTDINKYYAPDYFHPSGDGYAVWYESIREVVNERLAN